MNKNKDENQNLVGSFFFFELRTPRDMLEKTRREYERLTDNFHIDHVFNFFITAYHISDYLKMTKAVNKEELDTFLSDQDIKDCEYLCDKGKHLVLTRKERANPSTQIWTSCINGAPRVIVNVSV